MSERESGVTDRFLSEFGEQQVSRIAAEKALQVDSAAGEYANHRYYLALMLELVQIGAFLGAAVGLIILPFGFSWEAAWQTGLNVAVLLLARVGAEWCKPGVLTDAE